MIQVVSLDLKENLKKIGKHSGEFLFVNKEFSIQYDETDHILRIANIWMISLTNNIFKNKREAKVSR